MKFRLAPYLLIPVSLYSMTALAQTSSAPDGAILQALLAEVHQLRVAIERATSALPQTQLLLQRAQLQQQRVESLSRQLEQLRDQMTKSATGDAQTAVEVREAEARLSQEQDPSRRRQIEEQIKAVKTHLEQQGIGDQQQKAREGQLAGLLQNEQAKLNELNERLDALERVLHAPPSK